MTTNRNVQDLAATNPFLAGGEREQRLRAALLESERRFRSLADAAPVLIWMSGTNKEGIYFNQTWLEFTGRPLETQLGEGWLELVHPDDRQRLFDVCMEGFRNRASFTAEFRLRRADGQYRWLLDTGTPRFEPDGQFVGFIGSCVDITDRKLAEQALRQSEERFARFMQHLPGLAWIKDLQGRYIYVNDAATKAFGASRDKLYGKIDDDLFAPEIAAEFKENDARALASGTGVQVVETLQHEDGVLHHSIVSKFPIPGPDGTAALVGGMAIDVTERKRAEEALSASEERLRNAVDAADVGTWRVDLRTGLDTRDASLNRILGLDARESTQGVEDFFSRILSEDRPRAERAWQSALSGGDLYDVVIRILRPDGQVRWVRDRGRVVRGPGGEPLYATGAITDITERKLAEEALRQSEERKAAIFESAIDCLITMDHEGRIVDFNPAAERTFGWKREEAVGRTVAETIIPPHLRQEHWNGLEEYLRTGQSRVLGRLIEMPALRGDGTEFPAELSITAISPDNGPPFFTAFIRDITERKQAEEALKDADRRKDEFLATLAHELRNPLAPVRHAVQVFRLKGPDIPELQWAHDVIDRQIQQMTRLIDDLLDVSRISRGKIELKRARIELAEVIRSAIEASRPLIDEKGHELTVTLPPQSISLHADLTRLSQVFLNLLTNAAKYTERGGRIDLVAQRQHGEVVVSVTDTGIGIPADKVSGVFEMFAQIENPLTRSGSGLGIGLSLVKRLVEMHGGTIEARSDGLGRGSEFVVRLPIDSAHRAPVEPNGDNGQVQLATGLRVLVVDDNQAAATTLSMLLKLMGNTVHVAQDGEKALAAAEEFRPHVALLDIGLPKLNGYDVARQIRSQPWGEEMVLIAVTGWGQEEDKRSAAEAGFDHHLVKPVDPQALMKLLAASRLRPAEPQLTHG